MADNGVGIPEPERKKVFQRFYRLNKEGATTGYGLGLSLVAAIAKLHRIGIAPVDNAPGLRVDLSSPPGGGCSTAESLGYRRRDRWRTGGPDAQALGNIGCGAG